MGQRTAFRAMLLEDLATDHYALRNRKALAPSPGQIGLFDDEPAGGGRWDEHAHPRAPKGAHEGHGGEFVKRGDSKAGGKATAELFPTEGTRLQPALFGEDEPAEEKPKQHDWNSLPPEAHRGFESSVLKPLRDHVGQLDDLANNKMLGPRYAWEVATKNGAKPGDAHPGTAGLQRWIDHAKKAGIDNAEQLASDHPELKDLAGKLDKHRAWGTTPTGVKPDPKPFQPKMTEPEAMPSGIQPVTRSNDEAKAGDQLGLFGEAARPKREAPPMLAPGGESKGRAQALFDTAGNADQMDLFGDGIMPEELVAKESRKGFQPMLLESAGEAFSDAMGTQKKSDEPVAAGPIPFRDRRSFADKMAADGRSHSDIVEAMQSRGVAASDARRHAAAALGDKAQGESTLVKPPEPEPVERPKAVKQEAAPAEAPKSRAIRKPRVAGPNKHGIEDFGEKIGGARKDDAKKIGPRQKPGNAPKDDRPSWQRRYRVAEDANKPGEYFVVDDRTDQPFGVLDIKNRNSFSSQLAKMLGSQGKKLSGFQNFDSKEAAEAAVAQIELHRNHGTRNIAKSGEPANYAIYRKVSDKKRPVVKAGFKSHDEAEQYMVTNAQEVIEHQFPDWEDYSYLDTVQREGKSHREGDKDVKPKDFQDAFNFRGGEFGKWQMNKDGQTSLNHAYDALHDLSELVGLPPRAMSLDGKLAIAFGSRGTGGKHSAKAHYEPDKEVINLTKMKGAGSLAHEWFHALDHYMAQQVHGDDKEGNKTHMLLSERLPYGEKHKGRKDVVDAWRNLMNTISTREVTDKITGNDKKYTYAREALNKMVDKLDDMIVSDKSYNKRHKGLTPEQQKEWDAAKQQVKDLEVGERTTIDNLTGKGDQPIKNGRFTASPSTYAPLQKLNELYKKATGRSFHTNDDNSLGKNLYWQVWRVQQEADKIKQSEQGATMTKKTATQFLDDAHSLDEFKSGTYYAKDVELAARAFQGYIYDKTEAKEKPTQYLNGKAHNKHYSGLVTSSGEPMRPFPEGDERTAINAAFDHLFKTLKHETRTDDRGDHIKLYSAVNDRGRRVYRPMLLESANV